MTARAATIPTTLRLMNFISLCLPFVSALTFCFGAYLLFRPERHELTPRHFLLAKKGRFCVLIRMVGAVHSFPFRSIYALFLFLIVQKTGNSFSAKASDSWLERA